jgi:hypothetical protein
MNSGLSECGNFCPISLEKGLEIKDSVLSKKILKKIHWPGPGVKAFLTSGPVTLLNLLKRVDGDEVKLETGILS